MRHNSSRIGRFVAVALMVSVVAAVAVVGIASADHTKTVIFPVEQGLSGSLPAREWAAFSFDYPGPGNTIGVILKYSPGDLRTDEVAFDVYPPADPFLKGDPIASGTWMAPGQLYTQISGPALTMAQWRALERDESKAPAAAGKYVVVVNNWESMGRALTFDLSTVNVTSDKNGDITRVIAGPALSRLSAGK